MHFSFVQAELKATAKKNDERMEEQERLSRGESSLIDTIYSDEVNHLDFVVISQVNSLMLVWRGEQF